MRHLRIALACAAVSAITAGAAQAADGLGTLFFTPAQRAQFNILRERSARQPFAAEPEKEAPRGPDVLTYGGIVRPSEGKPTVWINGKPITERGGGRDISVSVRRDGGVTVAVPQAERAASLRVGQSVDMTSGTIEEPYARRITIVRPAEKQAPAPVAPTLVNPAPVAAAKPAARRDEIDPDSGAVPADRGTPK